MSEALLLELESTLKASDSFAGFAFSEKQVDCFLRYYELVNKWNTILHLTTLISPFDFAERHLFEACFLNKFIDSKSSEGWDLGTGLGIPGIVISVLRPEVHILLVETNRKKLVFLDEVAHTLSLANVSLSDKPIQNMSLPDSQAVVMVRAIDKIETLLPVILKMGLAAAQLLVLGNSTTKEWFSSAVAEKHSCQDWLLPGRSDARLIEVRR